MKWEERSVANGRGREKERIELGLRGNRSGQCAAVSFHGGIGKKGRCAIEAVLCGIEMSGEARGIVCTHSRGIYAPRLKALSRIGVYFAFRRSLTRSWENASYTCTLKQYFVPASSGRGVTRDRRFWTTCTLMRTEEAR